MGRPVHIETRRTCVAPAGIKETQKPDPSTLWKAEAVEYYVTPCLNRVEIVDGVTGGDLFRSAPDDSEVSLSIEDWRFLRVMEEQTHKNSSGHWDMPLPFRDVNTVLPNNRSQAVHRLNNLVLTLKRKPKMEGYLEFMCTMISKGHATPVPADEVPGGKKKVMLCPIKELILLVPTGADKRPATKDHKEGVARM